MKLGNVIQGKKIIITGASSGIGKSAAIQLAQKGAEVILVARRQEQLNEVVEAISNMGGKAHAYTADLSNLDAIDDLADKILLAHSKIDVLVNNAGRSIRRPLTESLDRYHDFERCMAINYYAPIRLIRKFLPSMVEANDGHIINSSTWGTLLPVSGFGAYNASKAALDSLADGMRMELEKDGIAITQIHFPLVHTKMSAATKQFQKLPGLTAEQAGSWIVKAVAKKPSVMFDNKTRIGRNFNFCFPKFAEKISRSLPFSV